MLPCYENILYPLMLVLRYYKGGFALVVGISLPSCLLFLRECLVHLPESQKYHKYIGPSEVRALPVRHCKRAAWQM